MARVTDEQLETADDLVHNQGFSVRAAAEQVGVSAGTLYRRYRADDPTPGGKRKSKRKVAKVADDALLAGMTRAAQFPAVPVGLFLHCDFCAQHFVNNGPVAAEQLLELAKQNPEFRELLESMYTGFTKAAWVAVLGMYAGIPLAHHVAPAGMYHWFEYVGMPPRGHTHAAPPNMRPPQGFTPKPADEPARAPEGEHNPFDMMDTESMMAAAKSMGIDFDIPVPDENDVISDATVIEETDADTPEDAEPKPDIDAAVQSIFANTTRSW